MAFHEVLGAVPKLGVSLPALLFLVWWAWYVVTSAHSYWRLRHIPGPRLASFTSWWWIRAAVGGKGHLALANACTRYGTVHMTLAADKGILMKPQGSIARIGPNTVVTSDPDLVRKMNASRGSSYTRGMWYKAFKMDAERENLFTELDEEKHMNMRNRVALGVWTFYRASLLHALTGKHSMQERTTRNLNQM